MQRYLLQVQPVPPVVVHSHGMILDKKSIHIKLLSNTHSAFRIKLLEKQLSMQEVFEECAHRIVTNDPVFVELLNEIVENKKQKHLKQLYSSDADSIYDAIGDDSPLKE